MFSSDFKNTIHIDFIKLHILLSYMEKVEYLPHEHKILFYPLSRLGSRVLRKFSFQDQLVADKQIVENVENFLIFIILVNSLVFLRFLVDFSVSLKQFTFSVKN